MNYYILYPEVAGELGDKCKIIYENGKIKEIEHLQYNFKGWLGDELLTAHPCFIVSEGLKNDIVSKQLSGIDFRDISVIFSDEFYASSSNTNMPQFFEIILKHPDSEKVNDFKYDFYYNKYKDMIVSEKALSVIKTHHINFCNIEDYII